MKIQKYFLLQNKKIKSWIKYWLFLKSKDKNYVLSDILQGTSFYLENSSNKNFNLFQINGNTTQNGTPTPSNQVPINSAGDNINLLENTYIASGTQGGITHTKNADGTMLLNGTSTTTVFMVLNTFNLAAGTYILSGCPNGGSENGYRQDILVGTNVITKDFGSGGSFTLNENTSIQARIRIGSGTVINNLTFKPMITKGSIATPYLPYGMGSINEVISNSDNTQSQNYTIPCQQPMRSIGNVRDEFVKQDGVWYEKHVIGQVVLNGSENGWAYDSDNFYFRTSKYTFEHVPKANTNDTVQLSNYFKHTSGWGTFRTSHTTNLFYSVQNSGYKICFRNVDITTVSDWTNWLQNHNVEVIYPTEEPYYLECTQEQIEALESIIRAYTYEPITNINSTDNIQAWLKIQYYMEV